MTDRGRRRRQRTYVSQHSIGNCLRILYRWGVSGLFQQGARFALKRTSLGQAHALYTMRIELPSGYSFVRDIAFRCDTGQVDPAGLPADAVADYRLEAPDSPGNADGAAAAGPEVETPEPWMLSFIDTLAKQVARTGVKSKDWPRKLRRWKGQTE